MGQWSKSNSIKHGEVWQVNQPKSAVQSVHQPMPALSELSKKVQLDKEEASDGSFLKFEARKANSLAFVRHRKEEFILGRVTGYSHCGQKPQQWHEGYGTIRMPISIISVRREHKKILQLVGKC